jgi:hypothetical protein
MPAVGPELGAGRVLLGSELHASLDPAGRVVRLFEARMRRRGFRCFSYSEQILASCPNRSREIFGFLHCDQSIEGDSVQSGHPSFDPAEF